MQLRIFRMSGDLVNKETRAAYQADWQAFFDKATERAAGDMKKQHRFLNFGERALLKKYDEVAYETMPTSKKGWTNLVAKYDDAPVGLARTKDGKSLVLIIMDTLGN